MLVNLTLKPRLGINNSMRNAVCVISTMMRDYHASSSDDVLFKEVGKNGLIILNKPNSLNALNHSMINKIYDKLRNWRLSKNLIVIKGAGERAFCAGGDVKTIALALRKPDGEKVGIDFFGVEYKTNYLIGTSKKPYVALINGITMGGGVGLSVHGKYRVATETTLFAMPETAIGFFPDVGATYFLPRLRGKLGMYLGLTGHRLTGEDVKHAGIATHFVPSGKIDQLTETLLSNENTDIGAVLDEFEEQTTNSNFTLEEYMPKINEYFSENSVEKIIMKLKQDDSKWAQTVLETLSKMSPTALKVTMISLEKGKHLNLTECLKMEHTLAYVACKQGSDFYEGVRALLIDKDHKPMWNPKNLEDVSDEYIANMFKMSAEKKELDL